MRKTRLLFVFALILGLVALSALATDQEPRTPENPTAAAVEQSPVPDIPVNADEQKAYQQGELQMDEALNVPGITRLESPMIVEIEAALAGQQRTLSELETSFADAVDEDAALDAQRQIAQVKRDTELEILNIQLRHARAAGREELATELEAAIDRFLNPPAPTAPATERPAPDANR